MNFVKSKIIYIIITLIAVSLIAIGIVISFSNGKKDNKKNYDSLWKDEYYEYYNYEEDDDGIIINGLTDLGKEQTILIIPKDCISISSWASINLFGNSSEDYVNNVVEEVIFLNADTELDDTITFQNCSNLKSVVLPENYKEIPMFFFENCVNLKTVTMGNHIEKIDSGAFENTAIEKIDLSDTVIEIESRAFNNCTKLKEIDFGESIEIIGDHAFDGSSLEKVVLPDTIKTIGAGAFYQCQNLKEVKFGQALEEIGHDAFSGCQNLKEIKFGETLKTIGNYAFYDTAIESIEIPGTVNTIEDFTFMSCKYLKSVTIKEGTESIEKSPFAGCPSLEEIYLPSTLKSVKNSLVGKATIMDWNKGYADLTIYVKQGSYIDTSFEDINFVDGINITKAYY